MGLVRRTIEQRKGTPPVLAVVPALAAMVATGTHANVVAADIDALLEDVRTRFPQDPFPRFTISGAVPGPAVRSP